MNKEYDEQIFDSLLEEMLTDRHPPDLTERIVQAWSRNKESIDSNGTSAERLDANSGNGKKLIVAELVKEPTDDPLDVSRNPISQPVSGVKNVRADSNGQSSQIAARVSTSGSGSGGGRRLRNPRRRSRGLSATSSYIIAALSISASVVVIAIGWKVFTDAIGPTIDETRVAQARSEETDGVDGGSAAPLLADHRAGQRNADEPQPNPKGLDKQGSASELVALPENRARLPIESLNPEDSQFSLDNDPRDAKLAISSEVFDGSTQTLSGNAIVAEIDQRLQGIWNEAGVRASNRLSDAELAQKIYMMLTGEQIAREQLAAHATDANLVKNGRLQGMQWAKVVTGSAQFAEHWSKEITRQWLSHGSLPLDGKPVGLLSERLAQKISASASWTEVPRMVLEGDVGQKDFDSPNAVFLGALAGNDNHRLLTRLGASFLNRNLACAKCHDSRAVDGAQVLNQQATYWSLLAMLNGIDAQGNGFQDRRVVSDQQPTLFADGQSPNVFYDLVDGRLTTAEARLPGGVDWRSESQLPREAFAEWLTSTRAFDRAIVNQTWKLVFGKHVVPQVDGIDTTAIDARSELLDFLASQFRAHNHDLKQLVTWIVGSDAFARREVELTPTQWLASTDEQMASLQIADLLFATGTSSRKSKASSSLEDSVAAFMKWSNPAGGLDSQTDGAEITLAQPNTETAASSNKGNRDASNGFQMPSLQYVLYGERHTPAETAFVKSLVSSGRLTWEQQVQHIIALSEFESENGKIQSVADELLQKNSKSSEDALLDLLWSVKNSNAG